MKTIKIINKAKLVAGAMFGLLILVSAFVFSPVTRAAEEGYAFGVSPMKEKIIINPGDSYTSSFRVYMGATYNTDINYEITVAGFYVDENYKNIFEECSDERCEMAKWIKLDSPSEGRLSPGQDVKVQYTINVPENATGGGQYASIIVNAEPVSEDSEDDSSEAASDKVRSAVMEEKRIAFTIYAEVPGNIIKQGEIEDLNVPGFLLSGDIKGSSSVKNTGNVHGEAQYKLQVFPLFSDEEIYTNEEKPADRTVLPDRTLYNEITWPGTPAFGIFNVVYTVEFEGVTGQVKKTVIKCPVWLLFIVIFAIIALIIWVFLLIKKRSTARRG